MKLNSLLERLRLTAKRFSAPLLLGWSAAGSLTSCQPQNPPTVRSPALIEKTRSAVYLTVPIEPREILTFSCFSPSNTYGANAWSAGANAHAEWFVPEYSGELTTLTLALEAPNEFKRNRQRIVGDALVFITEDVQGFPNTNNLESFSIPATDWNPTNATAPFIVKSTTHPTLLAGKKYWLGAKSSSPGNWNWYFNNQEIIQNAAREATPGKWSSAGSSRMSAFSVSVTTTQRIYSAHEIIATRRAKAASAIKPSYTLLQPVGHVHDGPTNLNGGAARAVAVVDNLAYVANANDGLRIYEISDPAEPLNLGHTKNTFNANDVIVSGNYAYVSGSGLDIIDISDPANPHKISRIGSGAQSTALVGNLAYVAGDKAGLFIYDISDPTKPVELGHTTNMPDGNAYKVRVAGNFAYVANCNDGLRIYDISNPKNPVTVSQVAGYVLDVAVAGQRAYLATGGLEILDISDPKAPKKLGSLKLNEAGAGHALAIHGKYIFVGTQSGNVHILDVSNPEEIATISQTQTHSTGSATVGLTVVNDYVYFTGGLDGLRIYSLSGLPK